MTDEPFDPEAGEFAKRQGMERAARSASPDWWQCMLECAKEVAARKPCFTTDDLERCRVARQGPRTPENRALGPLMKEVQRLGYCEPTADWVESAQKVNHRRPMRVWWSLIYRGPKVHRPPRRRRFVDPRQISLFEEEPPL